MSVIIGIPRVHALTVHSAEGNSPWQPVWFLSGMKRRFSGKWHCGHQDPYNPVHHGFDEFVGLLNGAGDHHRHGSWSVGLRQTDVEGYSTDVITDRSVDFVE